MKIIALVTLIGRDKEGNALPNKPGSIVEIDDAEAKDLIARGHAEPVGKPKAAPEGDAGVPKVKTEGNKVKIEKK